MEHNDKFFERVHRKLLSYSLPRKQLMVMSLTLNLLNNILTHVWLLLFHFPEVQNVWLFITLEQIYTYSYHKLKPWRVGIKGILCNKSWDKSGISRGY